MPPSTHAGGTPTRKTLRITNSTLASEALSGFQAQLRALDDARRQATTGLRVSRPSDDPVAVTGVMQSSSSLRALEQYQRNLGLAQSRLDLEDTVLDELTEALTRAKELAVSQVGATASGTSRRTAGAEVAELVGFVKDLANTQLAGAYIFGGHRADSPAYTAGVWDAARPAEGDFTVEVGTRRFVETNHSAKEIFVDTGAVASLQELADALEVNDEEGIRSALAGLDSAMDGVQTVVGDLGARMNYLEIAVTNLDSLQVNLAKFRSELEDADLAEATTRLVERQGALEAAMLANSKILGLTLTDYLR
ncbi:MAG: flagellar hook-associated protein 3 [Gemmatimonadetes bacterium]|nr:flagellar hook-associated protein 3 [Gemmatimonadota bacterium]